MAKLLLGKEVTDALNANLQERTAALRAKGVIPTLSIVRVVKIPAICLMSVVLPSVLSWWA